MPYQNIPLYIVLYTIFALFISTSTGLCQSGVNKDLTVIKTRFKELTVPSKLDLKNPAVKHMIKNIDTKAQNVMKSQILDSTSPMFGSWGTLKRRHGDAITRFTGRIYSMARAYAFRHSTYYKNKKLLTHITAAFEYLYPFIEPGGKHGGNWWGWDIGGPMRLGNTLILMGRNLPGDTYNKTVKALCGLVKAKYSSSYRGGGANALDVAVNQLRVACITGNGTYAENGAKIVAAISSTTKPLGIQKDYSYHFHGHGLNMGYGRVQLKLVSRYIYLTAGTEFALPETSFTTHENWFKQFIVWNSYKGKISPFTPGRDISRNGSVERPVALEAAILLYLSQGCSCKDVALSFIREWYEANPEKSFYNPTIAALALRFEKDIPKAEPMPTAAKFYPVSDYLACRMPGFYTAVRMSSSRTKAWFAIRGENTRGARSADGTLVIMTDGSEFENGVIPTMNWNALSGVTVRTNLKHHPEKPAHSKIVGGLSHETHFGMAGMDFLLKSGKRAIEARKSYTVTPEGIMLLGTRIQASGAEPADKNESFYTSLHHCVLRDKDTHCVIDGKATPLKQGKLPITVKRWLHVRNCGYVFPEQTKITMQVSKVTRSYKYINKRQSKSAQFTRRFYTLLVDHASSAGNGSYAVTILPDADPKKTAGIANSPSFQPVTWSDTCHAVIDKNSDTQFMYFFTQGKAQGFQTEQPLFLALSRKQGKCTLTVQDPSHKGGNVAFSVPFTCKPSSGEMVRVLPEREASRITVRLKRGWPFTTVLTLQK